jgi:hypothetical protein
MNFFKGSSPSEGIPIAILHFISIQFQYGILDEPPTGAFSLAEEMP